MMGNDDRLFRHFDSSLQNLILEIVDSYISWDFLYLQGQERDVTSTMNVACTCHELNFMGITSCNTESVLPNYSSNTSPFTEHKNWKWRGMGKKGGKIFHIHIGGGGRGIKLVLFTNEWM